MDPIAQATQFAQLDVQHFQQRYQKQQTELRTQLSALSEVESTMRTFRGAVEDMNSSTASVIKNKASLSEEGVLTVDARGNATSGNIKVFVEQVASAHQIALGFGEEISGDSSIPSMGTVTITINQQPLEIALSDLTAGPEAPAATMDDLIKAINTHPDNPGVTMNKVRSNGQTYFMLASDETGKENAIQLSVSGTMSPSFELGFQQGAVLSQPQDAQIWLGERHTGLALSQASNTFNNVISGVELTVSKQQKADEQPITISVEADNEATAEQLNAFVDSYNSLISTIDSYSQSGSEDQERGVLANDPTLRAIESQLSSVLRQQYEGQSLMEVGLSVNRNGKLTFDSDKFAAAQAKDSARLEAVFNGDGNLFDTIEKTVQPFVRFSSGMFSNRKDALQQNMSRIDNKQDALERKYQMSYDRYLKQFARMKDVSDQMQKTSNLFL